MKSTAHSLTSTGADWPLRRVVFFVVLVLLVHEAAVTFGFWHWNIGLGVMFAAFWIMPRRRWGWLAISAMAMNLFRGAFLVEGMYFDKSHVLGYWESFIQLAMGNLLPPFVVIAGVQLLVDWKMPLKSETTPLKFQNLIAAASVSAFFQALKDMIFVMDAGKIGDIRLSRIVNMVPLQGSDANAALFQFGFTHFAGAFVGVILIAPIAMWIMSGTRLPGNRRILRTGFFSLVPMILIYMFVSGLLDLPGVRESFRLLLMASVIVFALRFGWRGALLALIAVSAAIAWQDHFRPLEDSAWLLQAFIAIAGAMGLLFGALMDVNRAQAKALGRSSRSSARLHKRLALAAAANLERETAERHRIAGELHDEFGQNLTAFQTHLRLLKPDFERANRMATLSQLDSITNTMRQNVRNVLERLRPTVLDELGLYGAIDLGILRQSAEANGIAYDVDLLGDARLLARLDDSLRVAAYRLVQETVTNSIRHAHATICQVRIRIEQRHQRIFLFLDVRDNGIGQVNDLYRMGGLSAIHDHVTALGGRLHYRMLSPGIRVHALFLQDSGE